MGKVRNTVSDKVWDTIKSEYISSDQSSYRQLEKKYGVSYNKIQKRAMNENWSAERDKYKSARLNKSLDLVCEHQANECAKAFMVANKLLEKIERSVDAVDDGDTGAIKQLTGAIKDLKEIGIFRADLDRAEQMARIKKLQKEAEEEQTDMDVTITFKGDGYGV
jgi:uncharacterized protein YjcR